MYILNELPIFAPSVVGLDLETNGLDRFGCRIIAAGLSDGETTWILTEKFERLVPLLEDPNCLKVVHNADFDLTILAHRYNCTPVNIWDTLVVERVLNNGYEVSNALDDVLARKMGVLLDKSVRETFIDYEGEVTNEQLDYLVGDVIHLPQLRLLQREEAMTKGMMKVIELENRVVVPVCSMTVNGIGFDFDLWQKVSKEVEQVLEDTKAKIVDILGSDFYIEVERTKKGEKYLETIPIADIKWGAWQQTSCVLKKLGVNVINTTHATLEAHEDDHPFVTELLAYKKWEKLLGWKWDEYVNESDGRIHPHWNQVGANTGRFTSSSPNMQQIPRPTKGYPNFRSLFKPLPNHVLLVCDYMQQEPRCLAHISQDPKLIAASNEMDVYCEFAKAIWNKDVKKGDPERQLAKIAVLATFYGVFPKRLATQIGISVDEATKLRERILSTYPVAARWGDNQVRKLATCGYLETQMGRKWYFPQVFKVSRNDMWKFSNQSRNAPVQGTSAEMAKMSLCNIYDLIKKEHYDAGIVLMVHDEIVISVNKEQAEEFMPKAVAIMENSAQMVCPTVRFPVEYKLGETWEH